MCSDFPWKRHKALRLGKEFNTVTVTVRKGWLTAYLNGQWAFDARDMDYRPGRVGLAVSAGSEPARVEFRSVRVWALDTKQGD
jgi:hypothetical protein